MPTQRAHGGAALIPINLVTPGQAGLNTEAEATLLGPEWATTLTNVAFDSAGRASVRKGWSSGTSSAVSGVVMRVFEYLKADATSEIIFSTDADIFSGIATPASVEGSLAIAEGNIKFVNFNDKCIALGTGTSANPSVYTGTGNFTTVSVATGTAPTSGTGISAFGRLWVVDTDGATIRYCALLDETKWASADGGGTINMAKVWPNGMDTVMALAELAGDLVVFGKNNIVVWTDGQGSSLGIDPLAMYISDTIPNIGCISQFCVERAAGDLWFMSSSGLQTLSRAIQNKTTPVSSISKNVTSKYSAWLALESDEDDLSLIYSPKDEFMLCIFPSANKVLTFDTRVQLQDGTFRASEWSTDLQTAHYMTDRTIRGALTGTVGEIMQYTGNDDDGTSYSFGYESGWLDLGQELGTYLKFVKKMTGFVFVGADTTINWTLKYDFRSIADIIPVAATGGTPAKFNVSEFTDSGAGKGYKDPDASVLEETEFTGGISLRTLSIPGSGSGQYIKVGCSLDNASAEFALQQINLYAKIGRIAT